MTTSTGHTAAIRAKKVIGTGVKDAKGKKIGQIEDIVLDKQSNNIMFAVVSFGYALPWLETAIGLLILLGAWTGVALVAGALLLCVLTFGSTLHQDWNVAGVQLIYAAVYFVLIALRRLNSISVDGLFAKRARSAGDGQR